MFVHSAIFFDPPLYAHEVDMVSCTKSSYLLSLGGSMSSKGRRVEAEEEGWGLDSDTSVFEPQLCCSLTLLYVKQSPYTQLWGKCAIC